MPVLSDPLGWFTLEIPEGWAQATEDCVTTLTSPAGVLYLSGGRHARGRQASFGGADFLARFLRSIGLVVEDDWISCAQGTGCRIYFYAREAQGTHWRYWSVTDDETVLLISYACDAADVGKEAGLVDDLVHSVRLYHSAPKH